ncbi:MAG: ABC transporter ATP-binding protein [Methylobacterium sp.]|jgi:lipoprotein-releasing system ATP-binding protein|nr:ABC transporter ATP-binding protein [Methylobacterium sp.]MCA3601765.1 ABC transporter ATP-binding protein [Methylobacterium sp.]MCA3606031.1 ABC transporter ATP-binding protein [Methylobacterium sp.]MCA3608708.1 ABC transporter ATP-binding protein [Methylobacterium sp.]MCA3612969.1 ABC transporter ATP-binding protein [Methylobacterium sp.]
MTPLVETRQATRVLRGEIDTTLVRDIDLAINPGEFVAITGPSGSGKSSLMYLLGLLDTPTSGDVLILGQSTAKMDEDARAKLRLEMLGFVFQFHFLLAEFSALDNVTLPMRALGKLGDKEMRARGLDLLTRLGLKEHSHKRPDQLSGGQRQRVAIARALANDPQVILADEPTGNLDTASTEQVFGIIQTLVGEAGRSVIIVTHDPHLARRASRRLHVVDGRLAPVPADD